MPIVLKEKADEESTIIFKVTFKDEDKELVVPDSIHWTLTDLHGNVVNSRTDETEALASVVYITLSGDDLTTTGDKHDEGRLLTVKATYSSARGAGLSLNQQIKFDIDNFVVIT